MDQKINVWTIGSNFFFSGNANFILNLRNEYRIFGNLINFCFSALHQKTYVLYSVEEILIGVEFGFIKVNKIKFKKGNKSNYFLLKYFSNKMLYLFKNLKLIGENFLHIESKSELNIRYWRESILLNSKNFKKKSILYIKKSKISVWSNIYVENLISLKNFIDKLNFNNINKYEIFRDLWQRGFIIQCGIKFGAVFLIYAGEINTVHASGSVIVLEKPFYFSPYELISFGRIGTITKKRSLIGNLSGNLFVSYIGLKWNKYLP